MIKWFKRMRSTECQHKAVRDFSRWENAPSGQGFYISKCSLCGTEMTKGQVSSWKPVAMKDRE